MKIAVVAPGRHPISEPYSGGLEAFCGILVQALRARGHHVDLFAGAGSAGHDRQFELPRVNWAGFEALETDHTFPPGYATLDDEAHERLRHHLETSRYDVVHNNSLHPELLRSRTLPLVTTLHTPPVEPMASEIGGAPGVITAVSRATAAEWGLPGVVVVPNAVDTTIWREGPGGDSAIWFGRLVPEKAPHLAIDACRRAGVPLTLYGRPANPTYFREQIEPRLGGAVRWAGVLSHADLAREVARSRVAVVTPDWDEPFGLVSVEAMSCGTPVAAFARGGLTEILAPSPCPPVPPGDLDALACAIARAGSIDRAAVADYARTNYGIDRMIDAFTAIYLSVARQRVA